ncbi:MAG: tRNA pseudouridine(13) synthase TruD [Candidatus Bathyarchaeota archaeon]
MSEIPKSLWYEKRMLKHLTRHPNDFQDAIYKIPRQVLRLYLNAYQSHIFNEELRRSLLNNSVPIEISVPGFEVPSLPQLKANPMSRRNFLKAECFQALKVVDGMAVVRFRLKKGEYASTLLSFLQN